ncbi:hypothetical protein [uncultured Ruminobacter sp.]|uniref:hypothetical protein n=1 Tax=uncultured Ruminobacter sp. TaxID=538947 RepID=UPI0025F7638C|nr:hypothetical protein [uncultured Ruminobacter sp.]
MSICLYRHYSSTDELPVSSVSEESSAPESNTFTPSVVGDASGRSSGKYNEPLKPHAEAINSAKNEAAKISTCFNIKKSYKP